MTPDEIARTGVERFAANDTGTASMNIELTEIAEGRVTARMTFPEDHLNGHGTGHGGAIYYLAITAFGYAANTRNQKGFGQNASINYLAPVYAGDVLTATAEVLHSTRRTGILDVSVYNQTGKLVAVMRGTAHVTSAPWVDVDEL